MMAARRKDVQVITPAQAPAPTEGMTVLAMIDKLISRPDVPVEKIQQMLDMHLGLKAEQAKAAYYAAYASMQPNLPTVVERGAIKNKYGGVQSRYALWEDVIETISPTLAKYGFALSFRTEQPEGRLRVTGVLAHCEGHAEETTLELPLDTSGSKNPVQAVGSSVSYGKRYTAFALLNVATRGEDDDGQTAASRDTITDDEADQLFELIAETESDIDKFLKVAGVPPLEDRSVDAIKEAIGKIKAPQFKRLAGLLEKKRGNA